MSHGHHEQISESTRFAVSARQNGSQFAGGCIHLLQLENVWLRLGADFEPRSGEDARGGRRLRGQRRPRRQDRPPLQSHGRCREGEAHPEKAPQPQDYRRLI